MRKMRAQYESQNAPDELHQRLQTLISENARPPKRRAAIIWLRRIGGSAAAAMLALCIAVNASPDAAALLADIPVLGQVVRIFSLYYPYGRRQKSCKNCAGQQMQPACKLQNFKW